MMSGRSRRFALYALAAGGFSIGLTEFSVIGMLPQISQGLDVPPTTASWLVSGYAISVSVGAILLTIATNRLRTRPVLIVLMVLFIAGNAISGIGGFAVVLMGRIVAALCHGTFFGVGAIYASHLVEQNRKASAIAVMFGGLTLANVLGVPLGTFVAGVLSWRATFLLISAVGVVALVLIAVSLRGHDDEAVADRVPLMTQVRIFRDAQLWLTYLITVLGFAGIFGAFTYITFVLHDDSGFAVDVIPVILLLFGVGLFCGNYVGGRFADRDLFRSLWMLLACLTVVMLLFGMFAELKTVTLVCVFLMAFFGFGCVPGMQLRSQLGGHGDFRLSSAGNIAAFNVGNALGAVLCGVGIDRGLAYSSALLIGAGLSFLGLMTLLVAQTMAVRRPRIKEMLDD